MSARAPVGAVKVLDGPAAEAGSPTSARGRPVERTLSDQRRSPRRMPSFTAPPDVSDAVASLLQLPSRMPTGDERSATSVDSGSSPSLKPVVTSVAVPPTAQPQQKGASTSGTTPSAQARHNATERRRVHNLKCAYMELDEVIRSRPDLVRVKPVPDDSSGRRRSRSTDRGEDGGSSRPPAAP